MERGGKVQDSDETLTTAAETVEMRNPARSPSRTAGPPLGGAAQRAALLSFGSSNCRSQRPGPVAGAMATDPRTTGCRIPLTHIASKLGCTTLAGWNMNKLAPHSVLIDSLRQDLSNNDNSTSFGRRRGWKWQTRQPFNPSNSFRSASIVFMTVSARPRMSAAMASWFWADLIISAWSCSNLRSVSST